MYAIVLIKGRWLTAWKGGPKSYRGSPRLAFQWGKGRWFRLDFFGHVFSSATIKRWKERNEPLFKAHRTMRRR